jgi:hypothetical protein
MLALPGAMDAPISSAYFWGAWVCHSSSRALSRFPSTYGSYEEDAATRTFTLTMDIINDDIYSRFPDSRTPCGCLQR